MAKINYGPPTTPVANRNASAIRDFFGPGSMIGMTQRSAEIALSGPQTQGHRR